MSEGLTWIFQLEPEERKKAVLDSFAKVASTQEGKIVFAAVLTDLFFFAQAKTPEQQALSNFAKHLVSDCFGENAELRMTEALLSRSD